MSAEETNIMKKVMVEAVKFGYTLMRNNTGLFMTLDGSRKVNAGLGKGTHDLIGWRCITITPEMVGKQVAVFASCEAKTAKGTMRPEQQAFLDIVRKKGGISFIARNVEDIPL